MLQTIYYNIIGSSLLLDTRQSKRFYGIDRSENRRHKCTMVQNLWETFMQNCHRCKCWVSFGSKRQ